MHLPGLVGLSWKPTHPSPISEKDLPIKISKGRTHCHGVVSLCHIVDLLILHHPIIPLSCSRWFGHALFLPVAIATLAFLAAASIRIVVVILFPAFTLVPLESFDRALFVAHESIELIELERVKVVERVFARM
jgi:hypothetical protein